MSIPNINYSFQFISYLQSTFAEVNQWQLFHTNNPIVVVIGRRKQLSVKIKINTNYKISPTVYVIHSNKFLFNYNELLKFYDEDKLFQISTVYDCTDVLYIMSIMKMDDLINELDNIRDMVYDEYVATSQN